MAVDGRTSANLCAVHSEHSGSGLKQSETERVGPRGVVTGVSMIWWSCFWRADLSRSSPSLFMDFVRYFAKVLFLKSIVIFSGCDRVILGYSTPSTLLLSAELMSFSKSVRLGGDEGVEGVVGVEADGWWTVWVMLFRPQGV